MAPSPLKHLSRREGQIMEILYRRHHATVEEVRAELPSAPSSSSVRKLLEILMDRGKVTREYDGPRFVYSPATPPEVASRSALHDVVDTFFAGSRGATIAALLTDDGRTLTDDDFERLSRLLQQAREERSGR